MSYKKMKLPPEIQKLRDELIDGQDVSESTGTTLLPCPFCGGICKKCDCGETDCGRIICTKCKGEFTWHDSDFALNKMSFNKRAR